MPVHAPIYQPMRRKARLRHGQMAVRKCAVPRSRPSNNAGEGPITSPSLTIDPTTLYSPRHLRLILRSCLPTCAFTLRHGY
jgi:hypothetical protein